MSKEVKSVKLVAIGAVKGKTREVHGVLYKDGVAEVTAEYYEKCKDVIASNYSVYSEAEAPAAQKAWEAEQKEYAELVKAQKAAK